MCKLILVLILITTGLLFARSPLDTTTVKLLYGTSYEPLTPIDTVTTKMYYQSNNKYYIKPLCGGEIWAAWVKELAK